MSQSGDQLDCACSGGAGITDLVFDDQNQERLSWRFYNSRLPRSEVVYFTQVSIIVFLIVVSLTKLVFFRLGCEESTFWFSLLSCTVGYALPNPKLWIKQSQRVIVSSWQSVVLQVEERPKLFFNCFLRIRFSLISSQYTISINIINQNFKRRSVTWTFILPNSLDLHSFLDGKLFARLWRFLRGNFQ